MIEIFLTSTVTLAIVLYLQARSCARIIRNNRERSSEASKQILLHPPN